MHQPSTVVFIDTGRWTCFDQLSSAVRTKGIRTVRITTEHSRLSRAMARLCYGSCAEVGDLRTELAVTLANLDIDIANIVDIQATEHALLAILPWIGDAALPQPVYDHLRWRGNLLDKFEMSRRLRKHGIRVPDALDAQRVCQIEAASRLGSPMLLKPRVGFGGSDIRAVDARRTPLADGARVSTSRDCYWEQQISGDIVRYVASFGDRQILQEGTFVAYRADPSSLGPATSVLTTDDPALRRVGRAVLDVIGGRGLANIECVRAADGELFVIDVNLRVWGSAVTLRRAGVDFADGYLRTLSLSLSAPQLPSPVPTVTAAPVDRTRPDRRLRVFPDAAVGAAAVSAGQCLTDALRDAPAYVAATGWSYLLAAAMLIAVTMLRRGRTALRRSVRALRPWREGAEPTVHPR